MAYVLGAIAVAGLGQQIFSGLSQRKAKRRYQREMQRALNATNSLQALSYQQQENLLKRAGEKAIGGYDAARRETARVARQSKQGILDRESQLKGSLSQRLTDTGLGSTTRGANLQRGLAGATNRELADVDATAAGIYGNLALGKANAEAGNLRALGGLTQQRGDLFSSLAQMGALGADYASSPWGGNQPLQADHSIGSDIFGALQTGLGAYYSAGGRFGMGGGQKQPGAGQFDPQEYMDYLYDKQKFGSGHTPMPGPWAGGYGAPQQSGSYSQYGPYSSGYQYYG